MTTFAQTHPITDICFLVADVERASAFYVDKLGFKPRRGAPGFADFKSAFVLDAILNKNKIDPSSLAVTNIGFDMTPLVTGQVDAVTGWITNAKALSVIGPDRIDLPMKDTGLPSYANVYFATDEALGHDAETLAKALRAIAKGWAWTHDHPEDAANLTVDAYPQLDRDVELKTVPRILALSFDAATQDKGWGTFDPAALQEQIAAYDRIGQFKGGAPRLEDCCTDAILTMTAGERPKFA